MKTRTITLTIPEGQRLGQAIMNAYRGIWIEQRVNIWEIDSEEIQEAIDKYFDEIN